MLFDRLTFAVWWEVAHFFVIPFIIILVILACDTLTKHKRRTSSAYYFHPSARHHEIHTVDDWNTARPESASKPIETYRGDWHSHQNPSSNTGYSIHL